MANETVAQAGTEIKTCSKCKETKPVWEFGKTGVDVFRSHCKHCINAYDRSRRNAKRTTPSCPVCGGPVHLPNRVVCSEECRTARTLSRAKENSRLARETSPEKTRAAVRLWVEANPEKKKDYDRQHYLSNVEVRKTRQRQYYSTNKKQVNAVIAACHKRRRETDIQYKLCCSLRSRLNHAVKGNFKSGSAVADLGCSIAELKLHLERQFDANMTWENYGTYWHIDHIIPLASFDLTDREQLLRAVHWTNLQPLYWEDNLKKGARVLEQPLAIAA